MAIPNINVSGAAAAAAKSNRLADASAPGNAVAPPFSRSKEESKLPGLEQACVVNGRIPNYSFLEKAVVGDLLRTVRDVGKGDIPQAKRRLETMARVELGEFLKNNEIQPQLVDELMKVVSKPSDPKTMLADLLGVMKKLGASDLHPKLRPAQA